MTSIPSLIKWSGSKRSQARAIVGHLPTSGRYFEPFLGGGAVLFLMAGDGSVAGDVYPPLVDLWRTVQRSPGAVVDHYAHNWRALQRDVPGHYYAVRDRFNRGGDPLDLAFLMRTCVNGIARFNDSGEFNNSFHLSRPGMHPDRLERAVERWHAVIRPVTFVCGDYRETMTTARHGDVVYLDPPYAGTRQRYTEELDLERLFASCEDLNGRGVRWALSFDGRRGSDDLSHPVPSDLFRRHLMLPSGHSPVGRVLDGTLQPVEESLYLSW